MDIRDKLINTFIKERGLIRAFELSNNEMLKKQYIATNKLIKKYAEEKREKALTELRFDLENPVHACDVVGPKIILN